MMSNKEFETVDFELGAITQLVTWNRDASIVGWKLKEDNLFLQEELHMKVYSFVEFYNKINLKVFYNIKL